MINWFKFNKDFVIENLSLLLGVATFVFLSITFLVTAAGYYVLQMLGVVDFNFSKYAAGATGITVGATVVVMFVSRVILYMRGE